jgi:hypothetical protein
MTVAGMIFIPLAEEISMRFYLCLAFFPGVLFGWWWVQMRFWLGQKWVDRAMFIVVGVLVLSNSWSVIATLRTQDRFLQITDQKSGSFDFVTLGEVERIVRFMDSRTDSSTVILQGNAQVLFKSGKSIAFIAKQSDLMVDLKGKAFAPGVPIFFIETTNKQKASSNTNPALSSDREIIGRLSISRVHIP